MKYKVFAFVLLIVITFSFASCGNNTANVNDSNTSIAKSSDTVDETTAETASETEEETKTSAPTDDTYLLSVSNERMLTERDVDGFDDDDYTLAINEIYARHGRIFYNQEFAEYFNNKTWYSGTVEPEDFSDDVFNDAEEYNLWFLKEMQVNGEIKVIDEIVVDDDDDIIQNDDDDYDITPTQSPNIDYDNDNKCGVCYGDGSCRKCAGTGNCLQCAGSGKGVCTNCNNGRCYDCGGSGYVYKYVGILHGKYTCHSCNHGNCRNCNGTGKANCLICRGSGACKECSGTRNCQYCHGTGRVYN